MTDTTDKFVQSMLKSAKEKKEVKPQTRTEGVDQQEIEKLVEMMQGFKKAGKTNK